MSQVVEPRVKPTVGEVVHYVAPVTKEHMAAIVTRVLDDGSVSLFVLIDYREGMVVKQETLWRNHVGYSEDPSMVGTWHWPEREV